MRPGSGPSSPARPARPARPPSCPWSIEIHERLGSTNARALQLARPWHVVVTEHQTQGRGRLQRTWETPAGVALTLSATVPLGPAPGWLPLLAGLAVAQALRERRRDHGHLEVAQRRSGPSRL